MENEDREICPQCRKLLVGAVEVIETTTGGIPTILLRETADRNWIECDSCGLIVCKSCCRNAASGLCNACLKESSRPPGKTVMLFLDQPSG